MSRGRLTDDDDPGGGGGVYGRIGFVVVDGPGIGWT